LTHRQSTVKVSRVYLFNYSRPDSDRQR